MMKRRFFYFLILFILISCGRNEYEKRLVGNWYSIDENEKLTFSKDSLFIHNLGQKIKWYASKDSIKFKIRQLFNYDSIEKVSLKYEFKKDTLLITPHHNSNTINPVKFVKADKFLDVIFSKNNVDINLPINYNIERLSINSNYSIKVFLQLKNDSIIASTEYSKNIDNLKQDIEKHLLKFDLELNQYKENYKIFNPEIKDREVVERWVNKNVSFAIFSDKEIKKKDIRKVYYKLKSIKQINKIYQIYDIDESENVGFYILKGVSCD